ncbi:MAG: hypothetical protein WB791_00805 [Waddliaceae bacterium]
MKVELLSKKQFDASQIDKMAVRLPRRLFSMMSWPFRQVARPFFYLRHRLRILVVYVAASIKWDRDRLASSRDALRAMGGKSLSLKTSFGSSDAMFLDCNAFKKSLAGMGAQSVEYITSERGRAHGIQFSELKEEQVKLIDKMGFFDANWILVELDGRPTLINRDDLRGEAANEDNHPEGHEDLLRYRLFDGDGNVNLQALRVINTSPLSTDDKDRGVALLSGGNAQVYEQQRTESLVFLLNGINVMLYNPPGHSLSQGRPSRKTTVEACEAAYQYVKARVQPDDEKILAKGLCMGGGPIAELGAAHPNINIWLDQTPSDIHMLVRDEIDQGGRHPLLGCARRIAHCAALALTPNYPNKKNLEKNRGHILISYAAHDELVTDRHTDELLSVGEQESGGGRMKKFERSRIEGTHGASWYDDEASRIECCAFAREALDASPLLQHPM